ncbi:MAG: transposase [Methylococcaceae bacterium]
MQEIFDKVLDDFEAELLELNGEKDHVHLLVSYPPKHSVAGMMNSLKGVTDVMKRTRGPKGPLVHSSIDH